jgi:hypothetical protein
MSNLLSEDEESSSRDFGSEIVSTSMGKEKAVASAYFVLHGYSWVEMVMGRGRDVVTETKFTTESITVPYG